MYFKISKKLFDTFYFKKLKYKIEINRNPKVQCLVNTTNESKLPRQAVRDFAWLALS